MNLWEKYKQEYQERIASMPKDEIEVTLPDGKVVKGQAWLTSPYEIAAGIRCAFYIFCSAHPCLPSLVLNE
jgi:threonyl-tRNA synthetase